MAQADIMSPVTPARRTLSDDVYLLAGLLAKSSASLAVSAFVQTETARTLAKNLRAGDAQAGAELDALVRGLSDDEAETLVRAFTNYFQLINLAEDSERIRRIRNREVAEGGPSRGSHGGGASPRRPWSTPGTSLQLLNDAQIRLVLTAHPTEARRRTVIAKLARISGILRDFDERVLARRGGAGARRSHHRRGLVLGRGPSDRPSWTRCAPASSISSRRSPMSYPGSTVTSRKPFRRSTRQRIVVPPLLVPGTWIGGDRDGERHQVTRQALDLMRSAAIGLLDERLLELAGSLSVAESISGPAPLLRTHPDLGGSIEQLAVFRQR